MMQFTAENFKKASQELFELYLFQGRGCLICGRPCEAVGVYVPFDQDNHEAPTGKMRTFFYPVCQKCYEAEKTQEVIESFVIKQFKTEQ